MPGEKNQKTLKGIFLLGFSSFSHFLITKEVSKSVQIPNYRYILLTPPPKMLRNLWTIPHGKTREIAQYQESYDSNKTLMNNNQKRNC